MTLSKLVSHSFAGVLTINQLNLDENLDMFLQVAPPLPACIAEIWLTQKSVSPAAVNYCLYS